MKINIIVEGKIATVVGSPVIVCGNSDYVIGFEFDKEWDEFEYKTARFRFWKNGVQKMQEVAFKGNECIVPKLTNIDEVKVGVYAGDLYTTVPAKIVCERSILCGDPTHEDPPKDVYNQLMELIATGGGTGGAGLPLVGEEDEGKVLTVVGGKWKPEPVTIPYNEVSNTAGGTTVNIG